ncbi:hypothetical protein T261_1313 [Streptomyces lydicus]|nr:hypothetical protein T261_1313 [Streptomyces lydicus]
MALIRTPAHRPKVIGRAGVGLDNVVATPPHLGAGTTEAQEKAGVAVADRRQYPLAELSR